VRPASQGDALLQVPPKEGADPGVLVLHSWLGLNQFFSGNAVESRRQESEVGRQAEVGQVTRLP
jgi:hypothetical protein